MLTPKRPVLKDLYDAIDHALGPDNLYYLDDFTLSYRGKLEVDDLWDYDDLFGWLETDEGDPSSLDYYRGTEWEEMSRKWLKEGIPPIVVITAPDPYEEDGSVMTQIGDGRGRVNFANAYAMKIPVWHLEIKE